MKQMVLFFFLFVILFHLNAQDKPYEEQEEELFSRGYILKEQAFPHEACEILCHFEKTKDNRLEISVVGKKYVGAIKYYFLFLSTEYANNVVSAFIYDEEGNERHYYKINTNNEPANTWVEADMNHDGVIEEGEGHIAWW